MKKQLPFFILVVVLIAAGSFFGGFKYGQTKKTSNQNGFRQMAGNWQGQNRNGAGNLNIANFTSGEIIAKDDQSITVKTVDPRQPNNQIGSKIIFFSDTTSIIKNATGTPAELIIGETVMVSGTTNSDGSLTASSIQLRPAAVR